MYIYETILIAQIHSTRRIKTSTTIVYPTYIIIIFFYKTKQIFKLFLLIYYAICTYRLPSN